MTNQSGDDEDDLPQKKHPYRFFWLTGGLAAIVAAAIVVPLQLLSSTSSSSASQGAQPSESRQGQVYTFTDPPSDTVTPEACAFYAKGLGKPPAGQVVVVSNQDQEVGDNSDPLLHFGPAKLWPNTDKWYAHVQIGVETTEARTPYKLTAWLVDASTVSELTKKSGHDWWTDDKAPPGAEHVATANVTRKDMANCWKLGVLH